MEVRSRRPFRRRKHRLPLADYRGQSTAAFTICIAGGLTAFDDESVVNVLSTDLRRASAVHACEILLYVFDLRGPVGPA